MKIPIASIDSEESRKKTPQTPEVTEDIAKIAESMQEMGQLQDIIVSKRNDTYFLKTGYRRLEAAKKLQWSHIDARIVDDKASAEEINIHENLKRFNLPWYAEVELKTRLHEIRQSEHGIPKPHPGRPSAKGKTGWGVRDTARELGENFGHLSEDINLAREVRSDPTLKNIKDKSTAIKLVKQRAKQRTAEVEASITGDYEGADSVYCGSAHEILSHLPDTTFDACITDPPWLEFSDKALTRDDETLKVFKALYRVMKFDSFLYMFVGIDDFFFYRKELEIIGWRVYKVPLIWYKPNVMTMTNDPSFHYRRDMELILIAAKGKPAATFNVAKTCIFQVPAIAPALLRHPNEKPLALITQVLEDCTYQGSLVIDPFGGSGATAHACRITGRKYVTIERDRDSYEAIVKRLDEIVGQSKKG